MPSYKDKIRESLERAAKDAFITEKPSVIVVRNADGSVDGELRVLVPRGIDETDIIRSLESIRIPANTWFTIGTRYEESAITDESKDRYLQWRGYREAVRGYDTSHVRGEVFADAINIARKVKESYGRKASEVVVRLAYTPHIKADRPTKRRNMQPDKKGRITPGDKRLARKARKRKGPKPGRE